MDNEETKGLSNEDIKRLSETIRKQSRLEHYQSEITKYIESKLSDFNVPIHTIMEIAQYAQFATLLAAQEEVNHAYKDWERLQRQRERDRIQRIRRGNNNDGNTSK